MGLALQGISKDRRCQPDQPYINSHDIFFKYKITFRPHFNTFIDSWGIFGSIQKKEAGTKLTDIDVPSDL